MNNRDNTGASIVIQNSIWAVLIALGIVGIVLTASTENIGILVAVLIDTILISVTSVIMNIILMIKRVEGFVRDRSKRNVATVIL